MAIHIRQAGPGDASSVVAMNLRLARESERLELDEATVARGVRAVLDNESLGRYFLAVEDGAVRGQAMITQEWSDWRNARYWWLQSVYVMPEARRRGIFGALYRHILAAMEAQGGCGLRLYVHDSNHEAQAVYLRLGMLSHGYTVLETPDRLRP